MNSYKKLATVLTALCMTAGFTACGSGDWYSIRESVSCAIDTQLVDINAQIEALG